MKISLIIIANLMFTVSACNQPSNEQPDPSRATSAQASSQTANIQTANSQTADTAITTAKAYFAGGCFWCVEADFEKLPGVIEVISGYTGGALDNPTYKDVSYTETGHYEATEVIYNPAQIDYRALVDFHFRHIDPLDDGGQFCDRGSSYKTAIFVQNEEERKAATASKEQAAKELGQKIVTPILDYKKFWTAEGYHQDYYKKNPIRYRYYRTGCGRDRRVAAIWGKETK